MSKFIKLFGTFDPKGKDYYREYLLNRDSIRCVWQLDGKTIIEWIQSDIMTFTVEMTLDELLNILNEAT